MQQLARMHLAQPVQQLGEGASQPALRQRRGRALQALLERAAALVAHRHVRGVVGAEKVQHPDHVRVRQRGEGAAFLEEALQAVAEARRVGRGGRVLLDRHLRAVIGLRQVDVGEAAAREQAGQPVAGQLVPGGARRVGLGGHQP